jgi:hypothetical protein
MNKGLGSSVFRVKGYRLWVTGLGFWVVDLWLAVKGLGFRVDG